METKSIGHTRSTPVVVPESWGTSSYFRRLTRVDEFTADYWTGKVHRPAHRVGHPVPMAGCPGCAFESAVV